MLFFILLAGVKDSNPLNKFYFVEFETTNIATTAEGIYIPNPVRWTPYNYCAVQDGLNVNCTKNHIAYSFLPQDSFKTTTGIPSDFIDNRDTYHYLSRIPYGFYLGVIFFAVVSLFFSLFGCLSRLSAAIAAAFTFIALLFGTTSAALYTAVYVMGRNKFKNSGVEAHIGVKMFAFMWTVVALLLIAFILLSLSCCNHERRPSGSSTTKSGGFFSKKNKNAGPVVDETGVPVSKPGFFSLSKHQEVDPRAPEGTSRNYASSFERTVDPPASNHPMSAGFFKINKRKDETSSYYGENDTAR